VDSHSVSLITTLFLVFLSAIVGGIIAKRLKQPALIGYIASGIVFGNLFTTLVDQAFIQKIADVGVTLLLFTLGLEFSFHRLKKILGTVTWAATAQILVIILIFFFIFSVMGFGFLPSIYVAIAASLSSTAIIIKVLSEKGELETVPGELATGWSVVQDFAVIPIMIILPTLVAVQASQSPSAGNITLAISVSIVKSVLALSLIYFLGRKGIPMLFRLISTLHSREIFLLCIMGIVFLSALLTYAIGLSAAIGAFIAGLLISETSQNHAVFSEVRPLRDLFVVVFFVSLGMVLPFGQIQQILPLILGVCVMILFIKWFLVFGLTRYLGNHRKTAFLVALSLMQMSEFGFIIAKEGLDVGVLTGQRYLFLVALTFSTMLVGTTLFSSGHTLYYWFYRSLGKYLPKLFSTKQDLSPNREELPIRDHIVICGYGRVGRYVGRALDMTGIPYIVVDYNQSTINELKSRGVQVVFGDPADKEVLDFAQVDYARAVIIAIPDRHTQQMIISNAQTLNKHIRIVCRTHHEEDQKILKSLGVTTIVQPEFEAALSVINKLLPDFGISKEDLEGKITRLKIEHGLG
jgi:monovalent cation:H+ antiporter-2, CPA2 family